MVNGQAPGRSSEEEITFFKTVGVAAQDAAAALNSPYPGKGDGPGRFGGVVI